MHIHYGRDIPLALGALALLIGTLRKAGPCQGDGPDWFCKLVFFFVGVVLIGFGILGHYSPY